MAESQTLEQAVNQAAASTAHATEAAGSAHPPELPNFIHVLHQAYPDNAFVHFLYQFQNQVFAFIIIVLIALFFNAVAKRRSIIPGRLQAGVEMVIEALYDLIIGILGEKETRRYFPFLCSLFIFIWCMNLFGLIPLMKSPTSSIWVTASLAICVFLYVQYTAITRLGPATYFYHLLGEPTDVIGWAMTPLFLPLHILEELIRPLSLACRLFGNVYGEDILLGVGMVLGVGLATAFWSGAFVGIPLQFPFILLALLLSTIQAIVFTLLATVYFSMVMPHEEHHHEEGPDYSMTLPQGNADVAPHHQ